MDNIFKKNINKFRHSLRLSSLIFTKRIHNKEFIIVTGTDSSHYKSLKQLLSSIHLHEPFTKTIVFDLGMTLLERNKLKNRFKEIEIRSFNYSKYPEYFNVNINAGEYAWKPVIIIEILNEYRCSVCWMDAGNVITSPLSIIKKIMNLVGFYSPYSSGRISEWTHPKTLKFIGISKKLLSKQNLNGACIAINYKNNNVRNVVYKWEKCALEKKCIAPEGSNRNNHRQDQATLSVLAHKFKIVNTIFSKYYGFKIHQDID